MKDTCDNNEYDYDEEIKIEQKGTKENLCIVSEDLIQNNHYILFIVFSQIVGMVLHDDGRYKQEFWHQNLMRKYLIFTPLMKFNKEKIVVHRNSDRMIYISCFYELITKTIAFLMPKFDKTQWKKYWHVNLDLDTLVLNGFLSFLYLQVV